MVERTAVFLAGRHSLYAEHRYSAAIRSGDLLFVSGQVGSREDGTPEPDFQQQVRLAFDTGFPFSSVLSISTFPLEPVIFARLLYEDVLGVPLVIRF